MGLILFAGAVLTGWHAYKESNTMLFVLTIVLVVLAAAVEIVENVLEHKRDMEEIRLKAARSNNETDA